MPDFANANPSTLFSRSNIILQARMGLLGDSYVIDKFGRNPDVGTSNETVWSQGGIYSYLSAAQTIFVSSSAAGDAGVSVIIEGLDGNYDRISETIALDGTDPSATAVETTSSFLRVFRAYNNDTSNFAGDIYIGSTSSIASGVPNGTVLLKIDFDADELGNQSLMAMYTIPAGFTGYLLSWNFSVEKGADAIVAGYIRMEGKVFRRVKISGVYQNSISQSLEFQAFPEKTDLEARAVSSVASTAVNVDYSVLLIPNSYFT